MHPVCSISWCRNGSKLSSASTDNTVSVWDVLTGGGDYRCGFLPGEVGVAGGAGGGAGVGVVGVLVGGGGGGEVRGGEGR